jgi:DNA repair exonuclease SbcCD nuclease subunit
LKKEIVIVHTSDVHVDHEYTARQNGGDGAMPVVKVLEAAKEVGADVVLLCGDTFDNHKVPLGLVARVAELVREAGIPTVILPGNHDPAMEGAVWHPGGLTAVEHLHIIGVTHDEAVHFPHLDLEVWGRPHRDWGDMEPLESVRARSTRWQIAMAHGHYDPEADRSVRPRASWLINDEEITATGADYLALGHWNRYIKVGAGPVPAYYSGSPDYAKTVNVVRFKHNGEVSVDRHPLNWPDESESG